jgi:peptidoglycan/LPS O-acetylase OafA/YrhL
VLASCLLFGAWALLPDELTNLGKHTMAAAAFVANLAFWRESAYFAPAAELEPMLHLWSLGIEEQFLSAVACSAAARMAARTQPRADRRRAVRGIVRVEFDSRGLAREG